MLRVLTEAESKAVDAERERRIGPQKDRLRELLRAQVQYGEFTLSSGQKSHYYLDCRPVLLSAEGAELVGRIVLAKIQCWSHSYKLLAGIPFGGLPMAIAAATLSNIASRYPRSVVIPRMKSLESTPEWKRHGTYRMVEGSFAEGDHAWILDDVLTTGSSVIRTAKTLREAGLYIGGVICLVNRGGPDAIERVRLEANSIPIPIFDISELTEYRQRDTTKEL